MNTTKAIQILAMIISSVVHAQTTDAFVRQTDLATGQIYDTLFSSTINGTVTQTYTAPLPVGTSGARFELYAKGTAWDNSIYLLDTKLVYAYSPTATITLSSEDPYVYGNPASGTYTMRTRADRPFSVTTTVAGLVTDPNATSPETSVYYAIQGTNYDLTSYSPLSATPYTIKSYSLPNGTTVWGPMYHQLTSATLMNGCGVESFIITRYANEGVPAANLAQPSLQVWPVATAAVDKITSGQVFIDRIPTVTFTMSHLYPDSRTYAQIYPGPSVLGTVGTIITGTERKYGLYYNPSQGVNPTNVPQDVTIAIDNMSSYASTDGVFTLEVITYTPFFGRTGERLMNITFTVDRTISTRGSLSTSEQ